MLELKLNAQCGSFHLQVECRITSPMTILFGPSGSGKSTLLRLVAGLERPDLGHIAFEGRQLTDVAARLYIPPGERQTAFVAQQPALFPHLSVTANVAYGLHRVDRKARQKRVAEMLDLTGASGLATRFPRHLSGGELQRVSLARALAPLPRLLLLDEPFSALDGAARDPLLNRLQSWLAARNILVVLVTHDVADALAANAEVVVLSAGRLVAQGPAAKVLAEERTRLLARLTPPAKPASIPASSSESV